MELPEMDFMTVDRKRLPVSGMSDAQIAAALRGLMGDKAVQKAIMAIALLAEQHRRATQDVPNPLR